MYIHLGRDTVVLMENVIGIFDLDTTTVTKTSRDYLASAEKSGDVINITTELPKSFVVVKDESRKSGQVIYLSQISSATLLKRAEQNCLYDFN